MFSRPDFFPLNVPKKDFLFSIDAGFGDASAAGFSVGVVTGAGVGAGAAGGGVGVKGGVSKLWEFVDGTL